MKSVMLWLTTHTANHTAYIVDIWDFLQSKVSGNLVLVYTSKMTKEESYWWYKCNPWRLCKEPKSKILTGRSSTRRSGVNAMKTINLFSQLACHFTSCSPPAFSLIQLSNTKFDWSSGVLNNFWKKTVKAICQYCCRVDYELQRTIPECSTLRRK